MSLLHIPCRKKELSRRLLARIKGLCIQYPSGTAEAMPKFLADSFHAHSHLLAIFKGLCIFNPSVTTEAMPKFSDDLFYVQVRPSTIQANYRPTTTHQLLKQMPINKPKLFPAIALGAGTDFLRVIHCPNSRLAPMTLMRNMVSWLLVHLTNISRDDMS